MHSWLKKGTVVAQWLRCCATNWKVAGSILAGVSGFFIENHCYQSVIVLPDHTYCINN